jgi:uncharacterized protein YkwD
MKKARQLLIFILVSAFTLMVIASIIVYAVVYNSIDKDPVFKGNLDERVDTVRAIYDLPGLQQTDELNKLAQAKCNEMVERHYYAHKNPEGKNVWEMADIQYTHFGENLAYGYSDALSVVSGWENSKTHKENLLNPSFTQVGYGVCWDSNHYKVVQVLKG